MRDEITVNYENVQQIKQKVCQDDLVEPREQMAN